MKKLLLSMATTASLVLTACGGGGGGNTSVGGVFYSHTDLAYDFVDTVNAYMVGYDLELVKINTLQYDYVVVYDWATFEYVAYDLSYYNPGENISSFLSVYDSYFYFGLIDLGGNVYEDPWTGIRFNKELKHLDSFAARDIDTSNMKSRVAEVLLSESTLTAELAGDLAQAYVDIISTPRSQVSATLVDRITEKAVGFKISDVAAQIAAGDSNAIDAALESGSLDTGMSTEELQQNMKNLFKVDLDDIKAAL
ncbi:MAG: hypothetical protein AB8E15_03145 [Bdellovibrionales bacterium]